MSDPLFGESRKATPDELERAHSVEQTPFERGTDPLGDDAQLYRRQPRFIFSCTLVVLFIVLAILDIVGGHIGRAVLAIVIAVLNAFIAVKERAKPMPPKR